MKYSIWNVLTKRTKIIQNKSRIVFFFFYQQNINYLIIFQLDGKKQTENIYGYVLTNSKVYVLYSQFEPKIPHLLVPVCLIVYARVKLIAGFWP